MTEAASDIGRNVALLLLKAGAIHISREQPFMLAAGWASPVYVDCRVLIGKPEVRHAVTELSAAYIAAISQRFVRRHRRRGNGGHSVCRLACGPGRVGNALCA